MTRTFKEAVKHRRSYYALSNKSLITDDAIENIIKFASEHIPSAFNSQSTRMVLLLGEQHIKFWDIVKDTLREITDEEAFVKTYKKISYSFASGYGTVLFFEDNTVIEGLQNKFPLYSAAFDQWSGHTSAMHQFAVWTLLEDEGFGASLQHYNPIIDKRVIENWNLPENWTLVAQMPFGVPSEKPSEKNINPSGDRVLIFK